MGRHNDIHAMLSQAVMQNLYPFLSFSLDQLDDRTIVPHSCNLEARVNYER
jgi:hypothetical protein